MWPSSALLDLLHIEHPIIQAPMAGASTPALAGAMSNAGGLGSLACGFLTLRELRAELDATQRATNRPFNVNFLLYDIPRKNLKRAQHARDLVAPYYAQLGLGDVPEAKAKAHAFDAETLRVITAVRPQVVSFHFGLPDAESMAVLKEHEISVLCTATSVREALDLERRGADAIVAQGWEAGGHRGTYLSSFEGGGIGTLALVPQIVDAVNVPVIAAGGIADGRGISAAFALGASGVQIGTAFLTCDESGISAVHRQALLEAADDDTRLTKTFTGRPARGLINRYVEEMTLHEHALPEFPIMNTLTQPLCKASDAHGSRDFVALWSGQGVGMSRAMPAARLLQRLVDEAGSAMSMFRHRAADL
ncbi:MAG: nitronate monooxygenase [Gammaproteobacteria bacterium]|nr:nitronate monooxygenase [Gammaproteobacteria bacterium]